MYDNEWNLLLKICIIIICRMSLHGKHPENISDNDLMFWREVWGCSCRMAKVTTWPWRRTVGVNKQLEFLSILATWCCSLFQTSFFCWTALKDLKGEDYLEVYGILLGFASWYEPAFSILSTRNSVFQRSSSDKCHFLGGMDVWCMVANLLQDLKVAA